jgi:uncharacterized damage-inducible protein DinB
MNAAEQFRYWKTVRRGLLEALHTVTDQQLAFAPREGLWTLGGVARHIACTEEGWFRYVVTRELDQWPEFSDDDYPTVDSIKTLLTEVHGRTEAYLSAVDAADLDQEILTPWGGSPSLSEVIWHVLAHEIHHRGEIFLMLGLMGLQAPDV